MKSAQQVLLDDSGLTINDLEQTLALLANHNFDYSDIYLQQKEFESWSLENSKVKVGNYSIERGLGIRVIVGDKTGFAYADDINLKLMQDTAKTAREIAQHGNSNKVKLNKSAAHSLYCANQPTASFEAQDIVSLLQQIDSDIRTADQRVVQVFVSLISSHEHILVAASDGIFNSDIRPLLRLNISVVVQQNNQREQGSSGMGGRFSLEELSKQQINSLGKEALRLALINLNAKAAPAGTMDVILGAGWPGVLLHEAVGHGLEADFIRKQSSVYSDKLGKQVASELVTIVDDGTLAKRRGSLQMDDEGIASQKNILIENGILTGFMQDKLNARLMKSKSTGNGRRESYAHIPMPRMTNTFMLNGNSLQEEMISNVSDGIFAVNFAGGQVDITSGKFVFVTSEAYKVKQGKILYPIKKATLIGNGLEVMQNISMVGNDMKLDDGVGTCGKEGQSVPVGVGQPSLLVKNLIVGGTENG